RKSSPGRRKRPGMRRSRSTLSVRSRGFWMARNTDPSPWNSASICHPRKNVSELFELKNDQPKGKRGGLFAAPSTALLCRQALWTKCKQSAPNVVILSDFYKYQTKFPASTAYRAAKVLVTGGILERLDIERVLITKGKKKTSYMCAVRLVEPFTSASRKW